ncbi:MAG: bifunctional metallophosphatase/5'-nucleotidase [Candidatus Xenobiia bacterium LiM19]
MDIGRLDQAGAMQPRSALPQKVEKEQIREQQDSVEISAPSKRDGARASASTSTEKTGKAPLDISFSLNGRTVEKKIMGEVTDSQIIIEIKETNDVHGNMPSVANMIKPDDFWVDAGDAWQDYSISSALSEGRQEVELMNRRDCDIATTGNHFYDDGGVKAAEKLIEQSSFPYLSSNTEGMIPYIIADVEGARIAFIGVRTPQKRFQMVDPSLVKDLNITDPLQAVKKSIDEAKAQGADNIIVVSHLGLEASPDYHQDTMSDKDLAAQVPGIDLIIGGHSHTPTFEKIVVNGTRIVQAGIASHSDVKTDDLYLGEIQLAIDRATRKITSIEHRLLPVDRKAPLDSDVGNIADRYSRNEAAALGTKLGVSGFDFSHELKTAKDSSLGNLFTDAMRKGTGADVAVLDSAFFSNRKDSTPALLPKGEITMKSLVNTSPWMGKSLDTRVETWNVKGSDIRRLLEDGVNKLLGSKRDNGLFQVSGLEMTYNPKNSQGAKVVDINIGGQPLDENRSYRLTTTYNVGNWNPVFSDRDDSNVTDGPKLRNLMSEYIGNGGASELSEGGRITPLLSGRRAD